MNNYEQRAYAFDITATREEGTSTLVGSPIVYGRATDIGGMFEEVIDQGALIGADLKDVPLLVNHNDKMIPVARSRRNTPNSTLRLAITETGLDMEADIDVENNMTARELDSAVSRGDIDGMSFKFIVKEEKWERLDSDYPLRHIISFDKVLEISAVTWPAYQDTTISARSKEALDNARSALENERQLHAAEVDTSEELALLKEKTKLLGGN